LFRMKSKSLHSSNSRKNLLIHPF